MPDKFGKFDSSTETRKVSESNFPEIKEIRHRARAMGIDPSLADRVVPPVRYCPTRRSHEVEAGMHPGIRSLLLWANPNAIRDVTPDSLARKSVREQLQALAKAHLYEECEIALGDIWRAINSWLRQNECLLGQIEDLVGPASAGHRIRAKTLKPIDKSREMLIREQESFRFCLTFLSFHLRQVWFASIEIWSHWREQKGLQTKVPAHFRTDPAKQEYRDFIWSGVNTAIKMMINSVLLLYELYVYRENRNTIPKHLWEDMLRQNRSFISLFAAAGLTDFVALEKIIEEPHDPVFAEFVQRHGLSSWSHRKECSKNYQPFYDKRFFILTDNRSGIPQLDLLPDLIDEGVRREFGRDVLIRRCPALRRGIINEVYGWVSEAILYFGDIVTKKPEPK
ncbi:MAG: hypothetical protein AMJ65_10760 [Phycisphaerae bacterium SG8_4]|nr:MAG: hypothetical protein AMJ65_10760 [Phycisphaerae bacterium SG8_4]